MGPAVVVVVDGEGADVVAAVGDGDDVAVFFPGGDGEEPEGFLLEVGEPEGLGDEAVRAAGVEAVGEPVGEELVGEVDLSAAVNVVVRVC